jgi:hypothetical protein
LEDLTLIPTSKEDFKKSLSFGLLFYAIFGTIGGTLSFATFIFVAIPRDELVQAIKPLSVMAFMLYGSCALSLFIRSKIKKRMMIND